MHFVVVFTFEFLLPNPFLCSGVELALVVLYVVVERGKKRSGSFPVPHATEALLQRELAGNGHVLSDQQRRIGFWEASASPF